MRGWLFALLKGCSDARNVIGRALMMALHAGIASVLVGLSAGLVFQSVDDLRVSSSLARQNAAYFIEGATDLVYTESALESLRTKLIEVLKSGKSYAISTAGLDSNTAIAYGNFAQTFDLPHAEQVPYALVGVATSYDVGNRVSAKGITAPVIAKIQGAGYVDLWMEYRPLDDLAVVIGDPAKLKTVDTVEIFDLASRLVFTQPSEPEIASYLQIARQVVPLSPRWARDKVSSDFSLDFFGRLAFLMVFATSLLTTVVGLVGGLRNLITSRYADFMASHCVGARFGQEVLRLWGFMMITWGLPSGLCAALGSLFIAHGSYAGEFIPIMSGFILLTTFVIAVFTTRNINRADTITQLREGVW